MKKRWWGVIAAGVLVAGAYGYLKLTAVDATGLPVSVIPVVKGSIENKVMASGMVKAKQEVTLFSPNNGTLLQFNVQEGDKVTANQVIARIDVTDLSSEMASIDAQIASQHAELNRVKSGKEPETIAQQEERVRQEKEKVDSAEKEYNRTKQLVEAGASPATDLDKAKDSLSQAQSSLKMSQSELALNKKGPKSTDIASVQAQINQLQVKKAELAKQSSQSTVVAPFSGTVLKVDAKNGQAVTKGTEIITMGDLTKLQVVADINESDVKELQLGQKALVSGTSMGKEKAAATVTRISPLATKIQKGETTGKTKVNVTLELDQAVSVLKPGFNVDVDIMITNKNNILVVPFQAVVNDPSGSFVWVVENGLAKKRPVQTGTESDLNVEITSGLNEGDSVISSPSADLMEGMPVMAMEAGVPGAV